MRKLVDCCAYTNRRINGDGALTGYCYERPEGVLRHVLPDEGAVLMLEAVLLAAGLIAGVTGAWSPCGFSMVDTLAPHGYAGRLRTTLVACATFAAGALAGGVATFGGLALLGQALGAGGAAAIAVAAAVALAAAAGEARGARIVPQVRRQVPESWRRVLPLPLAAGLYGILLGLGFTTFILTFAVWALAGVSVALGDPALGLLVGLGFGIGRTLPVVVLAPLAGTERGAAAHAAMAERPAILRTLRVADAAALAACAAALWAAPAQAASVFAVPATDPSADGALVAFQEPGGGGVLAGAGGTVPSAAPGPHPAVGGGKLAWIGQGTVEVRSPVRSGLRLHAAGGRRRGRRLRRLGRVAHDGERPRRAGRERAAARGAGRAGRRARRREHDARPPRAGGRPAAVPRRGRVTRPDRRGAAGDREPLDAALRAARAAAQPVQRRPAAALRALDLPAPAAADRLADAPRGAARPRALRHRADRPPRRGPRARRRAQEARLAEASSRRGPSRAST